MKDNVVNFGSKQAEEEGDSEIEQFINQAPVTSDRSKMSNTSDRMDLAFVLQTGECISSFLTLNCKMLSRKLNW